MLGKINKEYQNDRDSGRMQVTFPEEANFVTLEYIKGIFVGMLLFTSTKATN